MDARIEKLSGEIGGVRLLAGSDIPERHLHDWMAEAVPGAALALARPGSTEEVSALLAACHRLRIPVVPQGGLTGLASVLGVTRQALNNVVNGKAGISPEMAIRLAMGAGRWRVARSLAGRDRDWQPAVAAVTITAGTTSTAEWP